MKKNRQAIADFIAEMEDNKVVSLWNEYARENNPDDEIFSNDESTFEELGFSAWDCMLKVQFGDWNCNHDWFSFNGYGNLESFDYLDDNNSPYDLDTLLDWLMDEADDEIFDCYDLPYREKEFGDLDKDELWELRGEITLNSIYLSDYENSLGIHKDSAFTFFEAYADFLENEMREKIDGFKDEDFFKHLDEYDNKENLWEHFCSYDNFDWVIYE